MLRRPVSLSCIYSDSLIVFLLFSTLFGELIYIFLRYISECNRAKVLLSFQSTSDVLKYAREASLNVASKSRKNTYYGRKTDSKFWRDGKIQLYRRYISCCRRLSSVSYDRLIAYFAMRKRQERKLRDFFFPCLIFVKKYPNHACIVLTLILILKKKLCLVEVEV